MELEYNTSSDWLEIRHQFEHFRETMETEAQLKEEAEQRKNKKSDPKKISLKSDFIETCLEMSKYPNYDERYFWTDDFSYSFEYFEDLFWRLIELAVLGSPEARDFARNELCDLMHIDTRNIGTADTGEGIEYSEEELAMLEEFQEMLDDYNAEVREKAENTASDEQPEEPVNVSAEDTETDHTDNIPPKEASEESVDIKCENEEKTLVDDMFSEKTLDEMDDNERFIVFKKLITRAIARLKGKYSSFTAEELANIRMDKDPTVLSRIRHGKRGTSRKMLALIGVGLELSCPEMDILFRTHGWSFPYEPHEIIINNGIKIGIPWRELKKLIPSDPKTTSSEDKSKKSGTVKDR